MPTYQYECDACGHHFEILQSMTDKKLRKCPKCAKLKLARLIGSGAGLIFKGTGFYQTDYKNKPAPSSSSANSSCKGSNCSHKPSDKPGDKPSKD